MRALSARRGTLALAALLAAAAAGAADLEVTVLDRDGRAVQDAVVQVRATGVPPAASAVPQAATIAQERLQFVPQVTLVSRGARLTFVNRDGFDHHVRAVPAGLTAATPSTAGSFELRLDAADAPTARPATVTVDQAGALALSCHLHGSMRGHVVVADSPWAAKTGADGKARFEGLPNGAVQVATWHADQLLPLPPVAVTTGAAPVQATVQLQVVPRRRRL